MPERTASLFAGLRRGHPLALLTGIGAVSAILYTLVTLHGRFRPGRMEPFFPIFFVLFALYAVAVIIGLRQHGPLTRRATLVIAGFGLGFQALLIPSIPTLSDDMYRYVWDGRVQGNGINPYRYRSNALQLSHLRDDVIWASINRIDANTLYPPGAQLVFAMTWRVVGDSVAGFKLVMIGAVMLAGWLLWRLLTVFGESPYRLLIYLWSPLLVFEVGHAAHVDALYLPLVVGVLLLRAGAPTDRVAWRFEAGIGVLIGLAALVKLVPAFLAAPLWSIRDASGKRRWRVLLPVALVATALAGYALYYAPGVNLLGFLPTYGREFFNIGPLPRALINVALENPAACAAVYRTFRGLSTPCWAMPNNFGLIALVGLFSLWCIAFPARTARQAVSRCAVPIGLYLLINHNLFSWYALWLIPLIALDLKPGRRAGMAINAALAWWVFTGTLAFSYVWFVGSQMPAWATALEFWPVYGLLLLSGVRAMVDAWRRRTRTI